MILIKKSGLSYLLLSLVMTILLFSCQSDRQTDYVKMAEEIHKSFVSIDSHTDTPLRFYYSDYDPGKDNSKTSQRGKVDFPRMKEGCLDGVFFAVFLGQGPLNDSSYAEVAEKTDHIFNAIYKVTEANDSIAGIALEPDDIYALKKENKRAVFIGIENGYPIGKDISKVKEYHDKGARYITLCHTSNNQICDSSTDDEGADFNGLSGFGEEVLKEMNRLGIMIDVSHISDSSFYDVLALSESPVIASHSCARALCSHPRNLNDDMLLKLADNGGVIQMCLLSDYVMDPLPNPERDSAYAAFRKTYPDFSSLSDSIKDIARKEWYAINEKHPQKLATVSILADHIDHIAGLIGIEHIGIGSDFDGGGALEDCYDVSQMKNITAELLRRGYSKDDIAKIWGENILRVFKEVREYGKTHS